LNGSKLGQRSGFGIEEGPFRHITGSICPTMILDSQAQFPYAPCGLSGSIRDGVYFGLYPKKDDLNIVRIVCGRYEDEFDAAKKAKEITLQEATAILHDIRTRRKL
jgi:hypothetical protein